ncbi:MAG: NAD(P)/FAD-dependent oxidoreductase [Chloroflexota bacterium]
MPEDADIVVVGAGPAGATSAILLARLGYHVVLIDRQHFPRPKPCGEYMSPGVEETMRRLGLFSAFRQTPPRHVPGMRIIAPSGLPLELRYQRLGNTCPAITIDRITLDAQLVGLARESGVEVREGMRVRAPLIENRTVTGVAAVSGDREVTLRSRLVIGADGSRSVLARALGLARPAHWPVRLGLMAHYREQETAPFALGEMHVSAGGYCGIAPLPGGRLNVAMVVREDALRRERVPVATFFDRWIESQPRLRGALAGSERLTPIRGIGPIGSRIQRAWYPGLMLVGDAAGFFDPFTGEGIFRGLNGAEMVADVAHLALRRGDVGERQLARYQKMRRERFSHKQAVTTLVQLFVRYPLLLHYALPRLAARPGPYGALAGALGDVADAREFLRPAVLVSAFLP